MPLNEGIEKVSMFENKVKVLRSPIELKRVPKIAYVKMVPILSKKGAFGIKKPASKTIGGRIITKKT